MSQNDKEHLKNDDAIAIIGMSGIFPMAASIDQFWENIKNGIDCVRMIPENRKKDIVSYLRYINNIEIDEKSYSQSAYLQEIDQFDYSFFNLSQDEAVLMDPAHRSFLQVVWQSLEDAGYGGNKLFGTNTGVFCGHSDLGEYQYRQMIIDSEPSARVKILNGNLSSIMSSRISYYMDWRGPNMTIDTSGSSSLVALNRACHSILNGECEQAIVGTSRINNFPIGASGNESFDGRTRSFDEESDGTGFGEGVIAILIKPLQKAIADCDQIHAVVRGSAINHDGQTNTPSSVYKDLLVQAWKNANVHPSTISFIEAHGSGNIYSDSTEIEGLQQAFLQFTDIEKFCAIGSVKSNIGHLQHAAGLAGVIKSILALKNRELPSTLHVQVPNQKLTEKSPIYIADSSIQFHDYDKLLRCGVSSFGRSGTNCHVILEEAPSVLADNIPENHLPIFTLSAKEKSVLQTLVNEYVTFLSQYNDITMNDLCHTANTGRGHYQYRIAVVLHDRNDLLQKLIKIKDTDSDLLTIDMDDVFYSELRNDYKKEIDYAKWDSCLLNGQKVGRDLLLEIVEAYIQGADIDWSFLYNGRNYNKISLPVYPFEQQRCWIEFNEEYRKSTEDQNTDTDQTVDIEETIIKLFEKYLGYKNISKTSNFYEMGGDSIDAIKIVNELNQLLNSTLKDIDIYRNPSVAELSKFLERQNNETSSATKAIGKYEHRPYYPLSSAQSRIFVMTQYDTQLTMYNKPIALLLEGNLNVNRLQLAFDKLIQRHDILRTSFDFVGSEPVQRIHEDIKMELEMYSAVIEEDQLDDVLKKFTIPFNLKQAPLLRAAVVKLNNNKNVLLFDIHHIISDGTSLTILFSELFHYYDTDDGIEPQLLQYKDYAIWQNELRQSSRQEDLKRFWMSRFSDSLPQLQLPTDFSRPSVKTFKGNQVIVRLDKESTAKVYRFAREKSTTLYIILLASYHLLLMQQSGQKDIVIGSVVQGRPISELNNMIGIFINTVIIRNISHENYTFQEFVQQVQDNTLEIFEHQDYPFEDLVTNLNINRTRDRNPLFDAAFILHNMYKETIESHALKVSTYPYHHGISLVDLALEVYEHEEEIICHWEYNTCLFEKETIENLAADYFRLLLQLIDAPNIPFYQHELASHQNNEIEEVEFLF